MLRWFRKLGLLSSAFALAALIFTSNVGCVHHHHDRGVKRGHHKAKKPNRGRGRGKAKGHNKGRGKKKGHKKGRGNRR
jgi:hypothetical protein